MFEFYKVGGTIRDRLLGLKSKDIDYSVVYKDLKEEPNKVLSLLEDHLKAKGYEIFLITPEMFTIRAKSPTKEVEDFVLARREVGYIPGTRRPIVELGTLYDDLSRRDFTLNALAEDSKGNIIDYFNGLEDLKKGILRTPLDVSITLNDDPLRILRALRFNITKSFSLSVALYMEIANYDYDSKFSVVSEDRIRQELQKCLSFNTLETLKCLERFPAIRDYIFTRTNLWLKPTNSIIYCDIPYQGTKQYSTSKDFNHSSFWNWCREKAKQGSQLFKEDVFVISLGSVVWSNCR